MCLAQVALSCLFIITTLSCQPKGVLGRRGVIVIDSDEESPRKNSPQKPDLHVRITPQNGPQYTSPQKSFHGNNSQPLRTYGTPTKPSFQTSPFKQQSPSNQSSSPWLSKSYGQQNGHLPGPGRYVYVSCYWCTVY